MSITFEMRAGDRIGQYKVVMTHPSDTVFDPEVANARHQYNIGLALAALVEADGPSSQLDIFLEVAPTTIFGMFNKQIAAGLLYIPPWTRVTLDIQLLMKDPYNQVHVTVENINKPGLRLV